MAFKKKSFLFNNLSFFKELHISKQFDPSRIHRFEEVHNFRKQDKHPRRIRNAWPSPFGQQNSTIVEIPAEPAEIPIVLHNLRGIGPCQTVPSGRCVSWTRSKLRWSAFPALGLICPLSSGVEFTTLVLLPKGYGKERGRRGKLCLSRRVCKLCNGSNRAMTPFCSIVHTNFLCAELRLWCLNAIYMAMYLFNK